MACCAVDDGVVGEILTIVNQDCPDIDKGKERNVRESVEWEDEGEDVIRQTLQESIGRVERMGCIGCRHDPLVMRLV